MNHKLILNQLYLRLVIILTVCTICLSCNDTDDFTEKDMSVLPIVISARGVDGVGPFFTKDHQGYPLIVWSEKLDGADETGYVVKYSKLSKDGIEILYTREVTASKGCTTTSESMSKIAVRQDGTLVSVYSRRTPTEKNRFAGALYYSQSFDNGISWTSERYLHVGDTTKGLSRSFFDLAVLPDGEVGAIWLDSRLTKKRGDGSTLFFAKTEEEQGFLNDRPIGTGTCQCCRTDLFVSHNGDIHVLYRDIWQDSIRDISHTISRDNGKTFSQPVRISDDDWVIYGCPHTGPSMCENGDEINMVWFTMGGGAGLYHTRFDENNLIYSDKELLIREGRHPQVLTAGDGKIVYLWEEGDITHQSRGHMDHGQPDASLSLDSFAEPRSTIKAQVWENGAPSREHWISMPDQFAQLPVGISLPDGYFGIAWIQQNEDDSHSVMYRRISG